MNRVSICLLCSSGCKFLSFYLEFPGLVFCGQAGEPQASWNMRDFMVQRALGRLGCVWGGAPSGTDWRLPEVRGRPQTSCPASVGPGMNPTWTQDQGHFIPLDDLCPRPLESPLPASRTAAPGPASFHRLSVNTLKTAFPRSSSSPPLPPSCGLPWFQPPGLKFFFLVSMRNW